MGSGYNVFEPDDLEFAQDVLDDVWAALPDGVRNGPESANLRERLARRVLLALTDGDVQRDALKAALLAAHTSDVATGELTSN